MLAAFQNMPERITTSLDDFDLRGLVDRLRMIDQKLKDCWTNGTATVSESTFLNIGTAYVAFRKRSDGMLMRTDPSANMAAMTVLEAPLPGHSSAAVPQDPEQARKCIARWLAILELPRFRTWGCQMHGDNPCDAIADHAASTLVAHNPKAAGHYVSVPVPSLYRETSAITINSKPAFAKPISDALTSRLPVTVHVTEGNGRHDYNFGVPDNVSGRCEQLDPVARLRALADTAHVAKPLLKAGLEAGS